MFDGKREDLEAAMTYFQESLQSGPESEESPVRLRAALSMAHCLQLRFIRTGNPDDLEESINSGRRALSLCPKDHPRRPHVLLTFADALGKRFTQMERIEDSTNSIAHALEALSLSRENSPSRLNTTATLATHLCNRMKKTGTPEDRTKCMEYAQEALDSCTPDHQVRPRMLYILGSCHQLRFENTDDLDKAIDLFRDSLESIPDHSPTRFALVNDLSAVLLQRYEAAGQRSDLEESIGLGRQMLSTYPRSEGHPDRARSLHILALCFLERVKATEDEGDNEWSILYAKERYELLDIINDAFTYGI